MELARSCSAGYGPDVVLTLEGGVGMTSFRDCSESPTRMAGKGIAIFGDNHKIHGSVGHYVGGKSSVKLPHTFYTSKSPTIAEISLFALGLWIPTARYWRYLGFYHPFRSVFAGDSRAQFVYVADRGSLSLFPLMVSVTTRQLKSRFMLLAEVYLNRI
jgi:hypothetical protein